MQILIYALFIFEAIVALLMIAVVMLQPPKDGSGGMGSAFGGGMGEAMFGGQVGNVLTKTTVVLGIILIVNTMLIALFMRSGNRSAIEEAAAATANAPISAPALPAAPAAPATPAAPAAPAPAAPAAPVAPAPAQ